MRCSRRAPGGGGQWGHFAVIARRWQDLEAMAALCRLRAIRCRCSATAASSACMSRRRRRAAVPAARRHRTRRRRVLVRQAAVALVPAPLHAPPEGLIEHPVAPRWRSSSSMPNPPCRGELVVDDLIEAPTTSAPSASQCRRPPQRAARADDRAHRAKGLEFDHVLILDGGWLAGRGDDERKASLYVAMTRGARRSRCAGSSAGIPSPVAGRPGAALAAPAHPRSRRRVDLGRRPGDDRAPGRAATPRSPHSAFLAALDVGSPLILRQRAVTARGGAGRCLGCRGWTDVVEVPAAAEPGCGGAGSGDDGAPCQRAGRRAAEASRGELVLPEIEYVPG